MENLDMEKLDAMSSWGDPESAILALMVDITEWCCIELENGNWNGVDIWHLAHCLTIAADYFKEPKYVGRIKSALENVAFKDQSGRDRVLLEALKTRSAGIEIELLEGRI